MTYKNATEGIVTLNPEIIILIDVGICFHSFASLLLSQSAVLNNVKMCDNLYAPEHF